MQRIARRVLQGVCGALLVVGSLLVGAAAAVAQRPGQPEETIARAGAGKHHVEELLVQENFDELDRTADTYRREKARSTGGEWRLREFYGELDAPELTDKDTIDHLAHLANWMQKRPESITARVAMATSLTRWAWVARGNGTADKVTEEGWRLFNERANKALQILESSRDMHQMCPQWYSEMMTVGLALNWDKRQVQENFERGVQFEPEYFYLYREYANYLLPKWDGEEGDAARFAKQSADKLGGDAGDILFWQIATRILKRGSHNADGGGNAKTTDVDWARVQRGYRAATAKYGVTATGLNELAFLAYLYRDRPVAQAQLALVGDNWSRGVWKDRQYFDRIRDWAGGRAGTTD